MKTEECGKVQERFGWPIIEQNGPALTVDDVAEAIDRHVLPPMVVAWEALNELSGSLQGPEALAMNWHLTVIENAMLILVAIQREAWKHHWTAIEAKREPVVAQG